MQSNVIRGKAMSDIEKKTPEDKRATAKEVVGEGLDLLTKIVKSGRIDAVGTGLLSEKSATGLAAFYVADGDLFDKILHTIVKSIEEEHSEIDQFVKLDADKVGDLHVHKVSFPIPEGADNREAVVKYIGEKLDIVMAVGKENVYIAAGRDAGLEAQEGRAGFDRRRRQIGYSRRRLLLAPAHRERDCHRGQTARSSDGQTDPIGTEEDARQGPYQLDGAAHQQRRASAAGGGAGLAPSCRPVS